MIITKPKDQKMSFSYHRTYVMVCVLEDGEIMVLRTQKVRLYPNKTMQKVLDDLCDYRRYCWNVGLALWNELYEGALILDDKRFISNEYKVHNELVVNKSDWQYRFFSPLLTTGN